ncbi:MAG: hypothetical protein QNK18_16645 [Gammaproteobacteria bacterium]|nr:hypothetical protein [Gammaproteobacteria bacterium]
MQPHSQPPSRRPPAGFCAGSGAGALRLEPRTRSLLWTPTLPLLDMAARRASEAARPVDAVERPAIRGDMEAAADRGAGVIGAGDAGVPAERVAPAAATAALPLLDMAARRAFDAARPAGAVDVPTTGARAGAAARAVPAERVAPPAWIPAFPVLDMA